MLNLVIVAKQKVLPFSLATTPLLLRVLPLGVINSLLKNRSFRSCIRLSYIFSLYYI